MKNPDSDSDDPSIDEAKALRRRAEQLLSERSSPISRLLGDDQVASLVHELQVHQIELELQNDALREARNRAEAALARYAELYDFAPVGYMTLDRRSVVREINLTAATILGQNRRDLEHSVFSDILAVADRRTFGDFVHNVFTTHERQCCEVMTRPTDRPTIPLRIEGTYFEAESECRAVLFDMTERNAHDATVRLHDAALEAADGAAMITRLDGTIVWVNRAFEKMTGYTRDEVVGKNPRDFLTSGVHDREFFRELWETILAGEHWRGEITNRRKDGSLYVQSESITPVFDTQGRMQHFVSMGYDLTEKHRIDARLEEARKTETIGRLAGGIAHDFNNLLTVINVTAELALSELASDDPFAAEFAEIKKAGDRASKLTRQLLAFGRKQIMNLETFDVSELIDEMRPEIESLIGNAVELTISKSKVRALVRADRTQIEIAVMNLAVNARAEMTTGGSMRIDVDTVDIAAPADSEKSDGAPDRSGSFVVIATGDSGRGLDREACATLFDPFPRRSVPGIAEGLGLAAVRGIVEQSGGRIDATSEIGRGTTIRIYLPRVEHPQSAIAEPHTPEIDRGSGTILVVDDEPAIRNLAESILRAAGYTVITAADGVSAISVMERYDGEIRLLLTDIVMPRMGGIRLAAVAKVLRKDIEVIFTSGFADERHGDVAGIGASAHFIAKPYSAASLTRLVRDVLDPKDAV